MNETFRVSFRFIIKVIHGLRTMRIHEILSRGRSSEIGQKTVTFGSRTANVYIESLWELQGVYFLVCGVYLEVWE